MRIERIDLYNIGSYENLNQFDFQDPNPEKRIVIIGGKNGAGKTTLFTAIEVCLYGHIAFGYKASGRHYLRDIFKLINNKARMDESKTAYVKLLFTEKGVDTDHFEVIRKWTWENNATTEAFSVYKNGIELFEEDLIDFQNYLVHMIPPGLLNLYFFDGEKIADYFLNDQRNNIKDALLTLSGNDTYEILHSNIRRLVGNTKGNSDVISKNYVDLREQVNAEKESFSRLTSQHNDLLGDLAKLEADLKNEQIKYMECGGISIEDWKQLQNQIKEEESIRERLNDELKSIASEILPFYILKEKVLGVRKQIEDELRMKEYNILINAIHQPEFRATIKKALGKGDRKANTESVLQAIEKYFSKNDLDEIKEIFSLSEDEKASIFVKVMELERFTPEEIKNYRQQLNQSIQRSKMLREQLQNSNIENFEKHATLISRLEASIEIKSASIAQNEAEISTLASTMELSQKKLESARKQLEAEIKRVSVSMLSGKVMLLVEELQECQYQKLLKVVEKDINLKFSQLIRKSEFIDHIYLDNDFSIHLIRKQVISKELIKDTIEKHGVESIKERLKERGFAQLKASLECNNDNRILQALAMSKITEFTLPLEIDNTTLSNGEKQILVMALYWAIMNQSQNELPFIIDTPFARIDTEHRANITKMFFKNLPGQLIILSTNEELRREHLSALEKNISHIYTLEYGDDKRSYITSGNYFEG